jgi:hypothetical protein
VKSIVALLAIFALVDPGIANAAPSEGADTYIGLQFGNSDVSVDGISDLNLNLTLLQVGVWVSDDISLEIRSGRGTSDETVQGVNFEIESVYGLYGLYHLHLSEYASLYGALGLSRATLKASTAGQDDESSLSYGVGAKFSFFSVDFMRYIDTSDVKLDVVSVGLQYTFD